MNPSASRVGELLEALDAERSHLGRKLHDTIIQNLAAISMHLEGLLDNQGRGGTERDTIRQCAGLVDESLREIRAVSYRLSPVPVPDLDLAACVCILRESAAGDGISLEVDVIALRRLKFESSLRDAVVRVIWDCVRGFALAGAARIQLEIESESGVIRASLKAPSKATTGAGDLCWWIVRERVGRLGGKVQIGLSGRRPRVEFTIPAKDKSWAAVH